MIAQQYDDHRIFGTLNQPYTTRMDGRYRSRSRWKRERHILWCSREFLYVGIAVLLQCSDPSGRLAPYGDILHDKLSFIISSNKMTQLQPQARSRYSLRVSDGAADDSSCGCRQSIIESEAALSTYCMYPSRGRSNKKKKKNSSHPLSRKSVE